MVPENSEASRAMQAFRRSDDVDSHCMDPFCSVTLTYLDK